ncbi:MFS transporter [Cytobacillus praedii]|uniref:CynX/NimT family MFS transporter n=1 Tax=Cytobacillus praedii TaxID=1742358 RepID=UPI002E21E20F|nr:MFS transporter [Cytobacillus praedii]
MLKGNIHWTKNGNTWLMAGIIFIAFTLRPAITAVGPLVGSIRADTGISNGLAGLLTTLPLLAFAIMSPFTPKFAERIGSEWCVLIGLVTLGTGIVMRSIDMLIFLFTGTVLIGLGIAICNVLLPGIVKRSFPQKVGLLTGIYTLAMGLWAGMAPGLSTPLAEGMHLGWQVSLGVWSILVFIAVIIWLPQLKRKRFSATLPPLESTNTSIWLSPIAWQVTFFMGFQSMIYFSFTAWLPEILHSEGMSISASGWMVTLLQFSGLPANFIIPVLADRLPNQKSIALGIGAFCFIGLAGLLSSGNTIISITSIIFIGIALGAAISHSLTLIGLRAANAKQAADLSSMAQSIGYLFAALGPFIIGYLFDLFHSWTIPLILLGAVSLLMTIAGFGAGRNQYVLQQNRKEASTTTIA